MVCRKRCPDLELIESYDGIVQCLKELRAHAEKHWPSGWEFFIPDDLAGDVLIKSIVGFRIKIEEINFKKKLSQNRSSADRAGILSGLETRNDEASRLVRNDMFRLYKSDGEMK